MKKILIGLLGLAALQASDKAPKIPAIVVYTTVSVTGPFLLDAAHAAKLHTQAKKYDFKSSRKAINNLQDQLVNANTIASPDWKNACARLNRMQAADKALENHLSFTECFKTAQKQSSPLKLSCRALGFAGFVACLYSQTKG